MLVHFIGFHYGDRGAAELENEEVSEWMAKNDQHPMSGKVQLRRQNTRNRLKYFGVRIRSEGHAGHCLYQARNSIRPG